MCGHDVGHEGQGLVVPGLRPAPVARVGELLAFRHGVLDRLEELGLPEELARVHARAVQLDARELSERLGGEDVGLPAGRHRGQGQDLGIVEVASQGGGLEGGVRITLLVEGLLDARVEGGDLLVGSRGLLLLVLEAGQLGLCGLEAGEVLGVLRRHRGGLGVEGGAQCLLPPLGLGLDLLPLVGQAGHVRLVLCPDGSEPGLFRRALGLGLLLVGRDLAGVFGVLLGLELADPVLHGGL